MKLSRIAIQAINTREGRLSLMQHFSIGEAAVQSLIANNRENGKLTGYACVELIARETGLKVEKIIHRVKQTA